MAAQSTSSNGAPFVSTSERSTFKTCRFRWYYSYILRLKPKTAAPALRFGSLIHGALEAYYKKGIKRGPHPARTFEVLYARELKAQHKIGFKDEDGTWHEAGELGTAMLEHYIDRYGADDEWEVLSSEQKGEQPIVTASGNTIGIYVFVLDLVMKHRPTGELELWDHKTAKSIDTGYLTLDDQSSAYWTYGSAWLRRKGLLTAGKTLRSIRFNFLRKALPDDREYRVSEKGTKIYLNQNGSDSKVQPSEYFVRYPSPRTEMEQQNHHLMALEELREMRLVRAGKMAIYKNPSKFNCGGCPVRDICELHQAGADHEEMTRLTMVPRGEWISEEYKTEAVEFEHEH